MSIFEEDIRNSCKVLQNGGTIIYPTDTIWGIGCDPTNSEAIEKIFAMKGRDKSKSLIILVNGFTMLEHYVNDIPSVAYELADISSSPLTIIYPKGKNLPSGVCADDGSIGIRICLDAFCNELMSRFRKPLVSTSANMSNQPSPLFFKDIDDQVINSADYVVNYRRDDTTKTKPSSIIKVRHDGSFVIIRQ